MTYEGEVAEQEAAIAGRTAPYGGQGDRLWHNIAAFPLLPRGEKGQEAAYKFHSTDDPKVDGRAF